MKEKLDNIKEISEKIKNEVVLLSLRKKVLDEAEFEKGMNSLEKQIRQILEICG